MELKDLHEFGLIKNLVNLIPINDENVIVGFGDDTACVNINGKLVLLTNDIQVENKHFLKDKMNPVDLGWKLVSVNVSDVVACGGLPKWGLISLALPKELEYEYISDIYKGVKEALDFYRMFVVGGNTSSSDELILDFFLLGETKRFVSRSSAQVGDTIFISGETGMSRAGLELLLMNKESYEPFEKRLIEYHTRPVARIDLQQKIENFAKSCIDISDGLVADLNHISEQSRVKVVIEKENIPLNTDLKRYCEKYGKNIYDYIFHGGEDYQLAFSVKKEDGKKFKNLYKIGFVEEGSGVFLKEKGEVKKLQIKGFEHF